VNQESIRRKTEEVRRQYDAVIVEQNRLQAQISDLKNHQFSEEPSSAYDWQQPDNKN
jgi:hypothetical protein